jgi:hypothetical protein
VANRSVLLPDNTWQLLDGVCDCPWLDNTAEARGISGGTALCGCGHFHARLFRNDVIHWEGRHWVLWCAFREAKRRLEGRDDVEAFHPWP